jgi:hypothetical protein
MAPSLTRTPKTDRTLPRRCARALHAGDYPPCPAVLPDEVRDLMMIVNIIRAAALPRRESARLTQQIRSEQADA